MSERSKAPSNDAIDNPARNLTNVLTGPPPTATNTEADLSPPKKKHTLDPELQAMAKVDRILSELSEAGRWRICQWLSSRHNCFPDRPQE